MTALPRDDTPPHSKPRRFVSAIAHQVYTAAHVAGYGDLDYASVVKFLESAAALKIEDNGVD